MDAISDLTGTTLTMAGVQRVAEVTCHLDAVPMNVIHDEGPVTSWIGLVDQKMVSDMVRAEVHGAMFDR